MPRACACVRVTDSLLLLLISDFLAVVEAAPFAARFVGVGVVVLESLVDSLFFAEDERAFVVVAAAAGVAFEAADVVAAATGFLLVLTTLDLLLALEVEATVEEEAREVVDKLEASFTIAVRGEEQEEEGREEEVERGEWWETVGAVCFGDGREREEEEDGAEATRGEDEGEERV